MNAYIKKMGQPINRKQPAYTRDQVIANLAEMARMMAGEDGQKASWIRFVANDIRNRGIK